MHTADIPPNCLPVSGNGNIFLGFPLQNSPLQALPKPRTLRKLFYFCAQPSMSSCTMWRLNNNWSISEYLLLTPKPQRITDRCLVYLQRIKLLSVFWPLCLTYPNLNPSLRTSRRPLWTRSGFNFWLQACTIMGTTWFKPRLLSLFRPLSNGCLGYLWHFCSLYNFSSMYPSPAASTEDMSAGFSCGHPSQQTSLPNLTAL